MLFSMRASLTGLLMLFVTVAAAQNITVRGSVKDAAGDPAIGATIRVQGSSTAGTVTDVNGNFTITCSPKATLDVVYIGYESQSVAVNGRTNIEVILNQSLTDLGEVVVVGYGTQKKVNVTGAVSMVGSEVLEDRPVTNVSQALQGTIPGLNLNTTGYGGRLNSAMTISIRGTGTIGNGSVDSPLILIDGIEGDINQLNPNDIESVSVLKDAASASIYGTRAAFGVILITTKSGKGGKVRVNYSGDIRFSTATQLPKMVNSLQFAEYFNAAGINSGSGVTFNDEAIERIKTYMNGGYTDPTTPEYYGTVDGGNGDWRDYGGAFANTNWFDEFYKKNVPSTQHNLSLSGGNDNVSYLISGGYLQNNGLLRHGHDELNRYNMNAKINAKLAPWARVEYSTKWSRQDYEIPQYANLSNGLFYHNIARRWPTCPVVDPNGHWMRGMEIEELENGGITKTRDNVLTQQLNFTFTPIEGWNIHADGALKTTNSKSTTSTIPIYWWNVNNVPAVRSSDYGTVTKYSDYRYEQDYYAINLYTDYTRSFGKHNGKVLVGMNYEKWKQNYMQGSGENLTTADKPYLSQTQENQKATDAYWHRATAGYFGRLNYDYDGIYLLEFNLRYDGSSRFKQVDPTYFYPSVTAGVIFSELFNLSNSWFSYGKLRGNWAKVGKDSPAYLFTDTYKQWTLFPDGGYGIDPTISRAIVLEPEMTSSWEIGADLRFFNQRTRLDVAYYSTTVDNQIVSVRVSPASGTILQTRNEGTIENYGVEATLAQDIFKTADFDWTITLNTSFNRGRVKKLPDDIIEIQGTQYGDIFPVARLNGSSTGISGKDYRRDPNGNVICDENGYPVIDPAKGIYIGNREPDFLVGLGSTFRYKHATLSFLFDGRCGGDVVNVTGRSLITNGMARWYDRYRNREVIFNGVQEVPGPDGEMTYVKNTTPIILDQNFVATYFSTVSSNFIEDGSYIRLSYVTLGYDFSHFFKKTWAVKGLSATFTGRNLFLLTKYSGNDPAILAAVSGGTGGMGIDNYNVPVSRSFNFTLKATF